MRDQVDWCIETTGVLSYVLTYLFCPCKIIDIFNDQKYHLLKEAKDNISASGHCPRIVQF